MRFSSIGILKHVPLLNPGWKELDGELPRAIKGLSKHFAVDENKLLSERRHAMRVLSHEESLETTTLKPVDFWPCKLVGCLAHLECFKRVVLSLLTTAQNASVERDLAVLRKAQLRDEGYDARCRVVVAHDMQVTKKREGRATGLCAETALCWAGMRRRQERLHGPLGPRGNQGPCPQRAAKRAAGCNRQAARSCAARGRAAFG